MHACKNGWIHTYIRTYIHTYDHTCIRTYVHTHTHTLSYPPTHPHSSAIRQYGNTAHPSSPLSPGTRQHLDSSPSALKLGNNHRPESRPKGLASARASALQAGGGGGGDDVYPTSATERKEGPATEMPAGVMHEEWSHSRQAKEGEWSHSPQAKHYQGTQMLEFEKFLSDSRAVKGVNMAPTRFLSWWQRAAESSK